MGALQDLTAADINRYRFSVADYHRMGELGLFEPDARLELLDGEIVKVAPIGSRHAGRLARLHEIVSEQPRGGAIVWVQGPLALPPDSEPLPDLMLLRPRADTYTQSLPTAADVLLLVEVSDTTPAFDRGAKLALYARHGVREVWVVDVFDAGIDIYREPRTDRYDAHQRLVAGAEASPLALPGVRASVARLFA
jgi:Uma2 family endonuclease